MELNADSCAIVSDNQNKSPQPSAQPLCSSGSRKKFSSLMSEMSDVQGTNSMASLLLEKEPTLSNSLEGPHFLASPLLEKAKLHCVQTDLDKLMPKYTDDGAGSELKRAELKWARLSQLSQLLLFAIHVLNELFSYIASG